MNLRIKILILVCLVALLVNPAMAFNNGKKGHNSDPTTQQSGDTTPPVIIVATPYQDETISDRVVEVAFYAEDFGGLAKFELYIDHELQKTLSITARELIFKWRTQKYEAGEHTLEVMAYDRSGNCNISDPVRVFLIK
jgi:hypothetical protein